MKDAKINAIDNSDSNNTGGCPVPVDEKVIDEEETVIRRQPESTPEPTERHIDPFSSKYKATSNLNGQTLLDNHCNTLTPVHPVNLTKEHAQEDDLEANNYGPNSPTTLLTTKSPSPYDVMKEDEKDEKLIEAESNMDSFLDEVSIIRSNVIRRKVLTDSLGSDELSYVRSDKPEQPTEIAFADRKKMMVAKEEEE